MLSKASPPNAALVVSRVTLKPVSFSGKVLLATEGARRKAPL